MIKIKYNKPKGQRIKSRFIGITTDSSDYWYNYDVKKWEHVDNSTIGGKTSHAPCNSVKSFVRKLKKLPKGIEFILVSKYVGYDVKGIRY